MALVPFSGKGERILFVSLTTLNQLFHNHNLGRIEQQTSSGLTNEMLSALCFVLLANHWLYLIKQKKRRRKRNCLMFSSKLVIHRVPPAPPSHSSTFCPPPPHPPPSSPPPLPSQQEGEKGLTVNMDLFALVVSPLDPRVLQRRYSCVNRLVNA